MAISFRLGNGNVIVPYEIKAIEKGTNSANTKYINNMNTNFSVLWFDTPITMGITDFENPTTYYFHFINDFRIEVVFNPVYSATACVVTVRLYDNNNNYITGDRLEASRNYNTAFKNMFFHVQIQNNEPNTTYDDLMYGFVICHKNISYSNGVVTGRISNNNPASTEINKDWIAPSKDHSYFTGNYTALYAGAYFKDTQGYEAKNQAFIDLYNETYVADENDLAGNSTVGGGGGSHITESDNINIPTLPSVNMLPSNMVSVYSMDNDGLSDLKSFLWTDNFVNNIKRLYDDPMENIIDLSIMPITPTIFESGVVKIGNVITDAHGDLVQNQFYELDLGTLAIDEIWGSALDYAPYTRALLYMPFVGFCSLDINKIMGYTLAVKYHVDIVTGDFVAFVTSDNQLILMRNGNLKTHIALSSRNNIEQYKALASLVGVASMPNTNPISMGETAINSALTVAMGKPNYESVGNFSSTSGLMSPNYCYVVFSRPNQCLPKKYKTFNGYPSYITSKLSTLSGFTQVNEIHLDNVNASDNELSEIESLLKNGVIL